MRGDLILIISRDRKAEGYAEGDYTQHSKLSVTEFIRDQHFLDRLASASEVSGIVELSLCCQ